MTGRLNALNLHQLSLIPNVRSSVVGDRDKYVAAVEKWVGISSVVKLSDDDISWLYQGESMDEVAKRDRKSVV